MIRFCDSDVACVEYGVLDRGELLSYFLSGHTDEIVCVYKNLDSEEFVGIITYYSLLYAISLDGALLRDYVIFDQDIWRNAREIFKRTRRSVKDALPLPVLNKDYQLVCFAYEDKDANREIRMLRELKETKGLLQFSDVFSEFMCVKIHEFNELAYFFAEYLREQEIQVQVDGAMWQVFFTNGEYADEMCQIPEYECLNIYAEGTWEKKCNWKENLLRSVSVEFECIDKIYEANIKNNLIANISDGGFGRLLAHLRGEKEVVLCGIDMSTQDAYDFLLENGIEACCFIVDELNVECIHRLFGKRIMSLNEATHSYQHPIFIDCHSKYSAWGPGNVDYYDYIGYKRNERFFVLRDYIEIPENNLLNALKNTKVILTGDHYLCGRLYEYLTQKAISVMGYLQTLNKDIQPENMPKTPIDDINADIMCIIVEPIYRSDARNGSVGKEERKQRIACLREKNIDNFTDYFCDITPFIRIEKDNDIKYRGNCFKPKRVVLGSILPYSGNIFFRSLLDSHPSVLSIYYCDLNNQLFWICVRLSMVHSENILPLFWKMIEGNEESILDRLAFVEKMEQMLAYSSRFTSQELFVMFHIAYMYMLGKDVTEEINSMIIYWEPHYLDRDKMEKCVDWLGADDVFCDIINVVRNSVSQKGSTLKELKCIEGGVRRAYRTALRCMPIDQKGHEKKEDDRLIVKFEDLKCSPRETLKRICDRWNMEWTDALMQTTRNGREDVYCDKMQRVSGFDLRPVYNMYDNFFSEFDRLRLMLIDALWQKKYGYPYVEPDQFTRKELQEMILKEFRFENPGDTTGFYKNSLELDDRIALQDDLRRRVQETRCWLSVCEDVF